MKLSDKNKINAFILLCTLVYFISYVSRINLSTVLVEVISSGFADKKTAALALTACAVTYGSGQIISGFLGDKFLPQNVILCGFLLTSAANLGVAFSKDSTYLVALWAVNGFAQALMWPPLVRIMTAHLNPLDYQRCSVSVSWGGNFGTVSVFLVSPFIISSFGLKYVFMLSGIIALIMAAVWKIIYEKTFNSVTFAPVQVSEKNEHTAFSGFAFKILLLIMLGMALQGTLRDGVASWTPTYISETFSLSSEASILTGVILPVFSILSLQVSAYIYRKHIRNEVLCAAVFFASGFISSLLLPVFSGNSIFVSLLLIAILTGSMHGTNMMLTAMTPPYFKKFGYVSTISGIINSMSYLGSAISTYGFAVITEKFGWDGTIISWIFLAALGTAVCFASVKPWKKFTLIK